jgi:phosphoribosyl-ATP pyrophosphohydrolase
VDLDVLEELFKVIEDRKARPKRGSYVSGLMVEGIDKIADKIKEESEEFVEACKKGEHSAVVGEAADLLFHALVLLSYKGVSLSEVLDELRRRRRS